MDSTEIKKQRTISITETTFKGGVIETIPEFSTDFTPFEIIGMLKYYLEVYTVKVMRETQTELILKPHKQ